MRGLRVWAKRAKQAKREKRAKLAKRRTQLAILTAALGFASWSVWGGASVENVENVATASAFADERSSDRRLSAESALKPKALPNHKAFIVGASDYINKNVPDLEGVKNDVEALTARLVEIGFEEKNIAVLIDGRGSDSLPTKDNIERRFNEFVDNLQEGDNVVLYLSGHGVQKGEDKTKETFFVPIDVNISSEVETYASSVSVDAMISRLEKNKAAEFRLAIIDACREKLGKSISDEIGGARRIASMVDAPKSVSVLYSCEPDKLSFEDEADGDGVRHGFFTRGLLDALDVNDNKADVDNDGELTFLEFVKYVSERTESLARAQGKEQKPRHFFAAETGDFVFLSDLLVDGLPRAKWNEAEKLYRDALELRNAEKWPEALQKIRDARKINPKREQYKTAEKEIETLVKLAGLGGGGGAPPGGGSTGGGTGGGTSSGSGWLPLALLALTGVAAGAAYWAGVRRRIPTRETVGASQYEATLDKWRRAKEEAERRLREAEEAERKVKEDAEEAKRRAKAEAEEKERRAKAEAEEAERKAAEAERRAREAKEEAERKAQEAAARAESERKAREAEHKAKEEAARKAKEEAERKAKEEAARKAKEEAARKAKEEAERKAKEEAERKAREVEQKAKEAEARAEAERKAREEAKRKTSVAARTSNGWSAEHKAGTRQTLQIKGVEYAFRYCPAGGFTRGEGSDAHKVTLTISFWMLGFWMLETPVTQAMWQATMGSNPSWFSSSGGGSSDVRGMDTSNFPVECVSWNGCQEFVKKLNSQGVALDGFKFRLPSEVEWEYACRAGTTTSYFWGDSLNGDKANCNGNYPCGTRAKGQYLARATEVGSYAANPWGLYDMHGNVWEWCEDLYTGYKNIKSLQNPINATTGSSRVLRGGSWNDSAGSCRSAERSHFDPTNRYFSIGFRLALVRSSSSR